MSDQKITTFKIAGAAGQGIKSSGILFARFAGRLGYHIFNYIEFPSIIRGGHNVIQVNISNEEVTGPSNKTDFLVALNQESIDFHLDELVPGAGIVYDSDKKFDVSKVGKDIKLCGVPLSKLAGDAGNKELLTNIVALGACTALLGGNLPVLKNLIEEEYGDKGEKIIEADKKAADLGYNYAEEKYSEHVEQALKPLDSIDSAVPRIILSGSQSIALGAISGGLQFAAIYPMSPISNILHTLAPLQEEYGFVYKQPEDELAAINMVIGASFAGARVMTATSGGGFCLMSEGYGLAGITETPVVIVEGMRGGPATGIPTWNSQGDLRFVLHAHQDDFPRIILAPGDSKEAFHLIGDAFNIAEKYQTPVVLLVDKNIVDGDQSFQQFDTSSYEVDRGKLTFDEVSDYGRYKVEENGISMRTVPGSGNYFIANSDEHDETGFSSEEIEVRNAQMKKRMTKLETCAKEDMQQPKLYGSEDADVSIISWGSNKGSILQALKSFDNVNFLQVIWMSPFPVDAVTVFLNKAKHVVNIEGNYTAQFGGLVKERTGIEITDNFLKYDGRPFYVEEIKDKINTVLKGQK